MTPFSVVCYTAWFRNPLRNPLLPINVPTLWIWNSRHQRVQCKWMRVKLGEERTKKGPGQYHFLQLELIPFGSTMETNQGLQYYLPLSFCKKYSNFLLFFLTEKEYSLGKSHYSLLQSQPPNRKPRILFKLFMYRHNNFGNSGHDAKKKNYKLKTIKDIFGDKCGPNVRWHYRTTVNLSRCEKVVILM